MAVGLGIFGAGGRMGGEIVRQIARDPRVRLAGGVEAAGHPGIGQPLAPGVTLCSNPRPLAHGADVLIDFTTPGALQGHLDAACEARRGIVIGTTGLMPAQQKGIDMAARSVPVLQAANTSLGVAVMSALVEEAARRLAGWDAEILELHHGGKADAPSGTALMLGEAVAAGRGRAASAPKASRAGTRVAGETGYASLRGGTAAGDHDVLLLGDGERLILSHRAESRAIFARGAIQAALWLMGKPAGRYAMADVARG